VEDEIVGTVIAASSAGILNTFQETYLHDVNLFVLVGGIAATLLAIAWGAWQSVKILRPVKALSEASHKLALGDYSQRIPVTTDDELGEMTQSFNYMAAELENQETLRRRSLADVAHELRTPLSVLQIDLESIEDGIIEPDAEAIQRLQLEVGTLRKLVEDLRILSLADAGELKLDFLPVEINGLLHINIKRMERQIEEKGVKLIETLTPESLIVQGDEQRLSQIFLNLLSNALQYTPAGGTIRVISERIGAQARITVADNGSGITAEDIPHIFERLYRSDEARTRQKGGSGLGLSIARSLVLAHGGKIWAESSEGEGSTFSLELPLFQE
jgi:signal transduction histidine kinase